MKTTVIAALLALALLFPISARPDATPYEAEYASLTESNNRLLLQSSIQSEYDTLLLAHEALLRAAQ